ncbi:hypothetical protein EVAR_75453_1 [Eumeta japonica]|uniref:Uncharacterized protein n=1 Tax=Eumeta variegata TaxID=151549 RepID=A0A4C1TN47_EUMVA|nr:hypothetical protein EVAR_75453_1 [Eumeta japonica]
MQAKRKANNHTTNAPTKNGTGQHPSADSGWAPGVERKSRALITKTLITHIGSTICWFISRSLRNFSSKSISTVRLRLRRNTEQLSRTRRLHYASLDLPGASRTAQELRDADYIGRSANRKWIFPGMTAMFPNATDTCRWRR